MSNKRWNISDDLQNFRERSTTRSNFREDNKKMREIGRTRIGLPIIPRVRVSTRVRALAAIRVNTSAPETSNQNRRNDKPRVSD